MNQAIQAQGGVGVNLFIQLLYSSDPQIEGIQKYF